MELVDTSDLGSVREILCKFKSCKQYCRFLFGCIAQLVEQSPFKSLVVGSIPSALILLL